MNEISCPHCEKTFKIDEAGYADIAKQVRDSEFESQLQERMELAEREKENAVELAKNQISSAMLKTTNAKDIEIQELKAKITSAETVKKLAVNEAVRTVEKERDTFKTGLEKAEMEKAL